MVLLNLEEKKVTGQMNLSLEDIVLNTQQFYLPVESGEIVVYFSFRPPIISL